MQNIVYYVVDEPKAATEEWVTTSKSKKVTPFILWSIFIHPFHLSPIIILKLSLMYASGLSLGRCGSPSNGSGSKWW